LWLESKAADRPRNRVNSIMQSYMLKDIKSLIKEENLRAFNNLLILLAQRQGSISNVSSLANEVGLSAKTIESYLELFAQTYTVFPLSSYSSNYGNELRKSRKFYLFDPGIRNVLIKNFAPPENRPDTGILAESFVFLEFNRLVSPETELTFWRLKSGEEVDFIVSKNRKPYPVEVKSLRKIGDIPNGMRAFIRRYPKTEKAFVLNRDSEGETNFNDTKVIYAKWIDVPLLFDLME